MHRQERSEQAVRPAEGDQIAQLLRLVGPREDIPPERTVRVKTAIHAVWLEDVHRRHRRRRTYLRAGALAVAALALLALGVALRLVPGYLPVAEQVRAATVESASSIAAFTVGDPVFEGTHLDTAAEGRIALRLEGGPSMRLDTGTVVRLDSSSSLTLERGTVYVDTGVSSARRSSPVGSPRVEVRTVFGIATDVGTQFEVRVGEDLLRLRVREGEVRFDHDGSIHAAAAGVELTVDAAGGVHRGRVALHGTPWDWTLAVAPQFDLEGRSLAEILDWTSRETGWQIRFRDEAAVRAKLDEVLRGTVPKLRADQAVFRVLPTYGLEARLEDGILWIEHFR